jgi:hypothetical protein
MRRVFGFAVLFLAFAALSSAQTTSTTRLIPYSGTALDATGQLLGGSAVGWAAILSGDDGRLQRPTS